MVTVLIPTQPDDTHAIYVKFALEAKGHKCILWFTGDYPTQQAHTFIMQDKSIEWVTTGIDKDKKQISCDVIWLRRPRKPLLPDYLHPEDVPHAEKENSIFFQSFWMMLKERAVWVNTIEGRLAANSKVWQLKCAARVGLNYPRTLIANNPDQIKKFISESSNPEVIYKTLTPMMWFGSSDAWLAYAVPISINQLPSDRMLQTVPGIFQECIPKLCELRITYFGDDYMAVKIDSQNHPRAKNDWRYAPVHELGLQRVDIPADVDMKCRRLMQELGIVFGCIDMIVTPDNEYVFLEINEQGQFLWIEEVNKQVPMLDTFANFLISKGSKSKINSSGHKVSLLDFEKSVKAYVEEATKEHKGTVLMKQSHREKRCADVAI